MKTLYIDMDGVLVDFESGVAQLDDDTRRAYDGRLDEAPGIFATMAPVEGAIEAFHMLSRRFDVYILSTAPWENASAWSDKLEWVKRHLGEPAYKRLILTHHKELNRGDYLIDDRTKNGVDGFDGQHLHFGTEPFLDWPAVLRFLLHETKSVGKPKSNPKGT